MTISMGGAIAWQMFGAARCCMHVLKVDRKGAQMMQIRKVTESDLIRNKSSKVARTVHGGYVCIFNGIRTM